MARSCPFCGAKASTQEHVWGEALTERLAARPEFTTVVRGAKAAPATGHVKDHSVRRAWESKALALTVSVCQACNNGWMSDLETACGDLLVAMARGKHKLLSRGMSRLLALYAVKTAVTQDTATNPGERIVPEEDARRLAVEQDLSPRISVSLYAYRGDRFASSRLLAPVLYPRHRTRDPRQGFQVTLGLGCLVLQVLGFSGPEDWPLLPKGVSADFRTQIWPPAIDRIAAVHWPPPWVLNDHGLEDLGARGPWFDPATVQWTSSSGLAEEAP